jgi:peroxisomal enoyl-CoA hydratase 2
MPLVDDLLGHEYEPFTVTVEAVKIDEFRRSLGETPGSDRLAVAPPTFTRNFWWEGFGVHDDLGFVWENVLHGQQEFFYHRPLEAGQRLTATMRVAEVYRKEGGRGGRMTFAVVETSYHDEDGRLVVVGKRTLIETEPSPPQADDAEPGDGSITPAVYGDLEVGDEAPALRMGPLTRSDFVRYAGASGDFNPIHHDDVAAIRAGNERPFAMGMLAAGYLGRLLEYWLPAGALQRYRIRFVSRVWPQDVLTCRAVVTGCGMQGDDKLVDLAVWVENQHGERVITGDAGTAWRT